MSEPTTTTAPEPLNIYQKLAKITGEIGAIKKSGHNSEQNFNFIEYAAVAGELRALFAKYGVIILPEMQKSTDQTRTPITSKYGKEGEHILVDFNFVVVNADKPEDRFSVPWTGEASAFDDKGTNKAATSALKYYLMRQFNISEKGEDPDAESPEGNGTKQKASASQAPKRITSAQAALLLGWAKTASGLPTKEEVVTFIEEESGKKFAELTEADVPGLQAKFKAGDGGAS